MHKLFPGHLGDASLSDWFGLYLYGMVPLQHSQVIKIPFCPSVSTLKELGHRSGV